MRLHVLPPSPRAIKAIALDNHLGLGCEIRVLDFFNEDQRRPDLVALNPNKRQPVLEDEDFTLWESNAILHYLASKRPEAGLWPSDARGQADVIRWLSWESSHWDHACDILITERLKKLFFKTRDGGRRTEGRAAAPGAPDPARIAEGERYFAELARVLDDHLRGRAFLLGDRLSIADFAIAAWIPSADPAGYPIGGYPEIARWYRAIEALPGWQAAIPRPPS